MDQSARSDSPQRCSRRMRMTKRPEPVLTKFHDNKVLAYMEAQALKSGFVYTEIESKKGLSFKGRY